MAKSTKISLKTSIFAAKITSHFTHSNNSYRHALEEEDNNDDLESDHIDVNEEEANTRSTATRTSNTNQLNRRSTFEFFINYDKEFVLDTIDSNTQDMIYDHVFNAQKFRDLINVKLENFFEVSKYLQKQLQQLENNLTTTKVKHEVVKTNIVKLRDHRDELKSQIQWYLENYSRIETKLKQLRDDQSKRSTRSRRQSSIYNSEKNNILKDETRSSHERMNAIYEHMIIETIHNDRWSNSQSFIDETSQWESWKLNLLFKIKHNWRFFSNESFRIDLARTYCKSEIWNVIRTRVNFENLNHYKKLDELLVDLELNFEKKNRVQINLNIVNDVDFKMKVIDKNESFDQFLIRFNITIASLNWDDDMKKHYLRRFLITRLARQMIILNFSHDFVVICNRLRQIDRVNNTLDKEQGKKRSFTRSKSRRTRDLNTRSNRVSIKNKSRKTETSKSTDFHEKFARKSSARSFASNATNQIIDSTILLFARKHSRLSRRN